MQVVQIPIGHGDGEKGTNERKYRKRNDLLIEHEEEREKKGVVGESRQKEKIRGEKKREMQSINTKERLQ